MANRILIIEDEEKIARFVELELKHEGNEVEKAFDGREGLEKALSGCFDLILLDVMLPGLNGLEVLRRLRMEKDTPVIMLTARDAVMDKVSGLDAGADDYITKPFAIEELLARIRVALKKRGPVAMAPAHTLSIKGVTLDEDRYEVTVNGEAVELTNREFELLRTLMRNKNIVSGPSAGAHLSSILCYSQRWQKALNVDVSKIIDFIGVGDPYSFSGHMSLSVKLLLNQLFKKGYDRKLGEPCFLMDKNHIPMLLIQSKHDGLIEYSCAEKLYEKANYIGNECELYSVVDKKNTHSWYTAGMFLETREFRIG